MNRPRILLSVSAMDEAFAALYSALQQRAEVEIADLEHYSLRGTDIFIGKKMPEGKLAEAVDAARAAAKKAKDFARADALRAEIAAMGWTVVDTAQGPQVSKN